MIPTLFHAHLSVVVIDRCHHFAAMKSNIAVAPATSQLWVSGIPSVNTGPINLAILNYNFVRVEAALVPPPVLQTSLLYYATAFFAIDFSSNHFFFTLSTSGFGPAPRAFMR